MTSRRLEDPTGAAACDRFERRLDEGAGADLPEEWRTHVTGCARCARTWEAARAVDDLLAHPDAPAPAGFTDAVMLRVAAAPRAARAWAPAIEDAMPWWVRVAAQPSSVLAALVAALSVWKWTALLSAGRAALVAVDAATSASVGAIGATPIGGAAALAASAWACASAALGALGASLASVWHAAGSVPQEAVWVGVLPVLWWASVEMMRWAEGLTALRRDPTLH